MINYLSIFIELMSLIPLNKTYFYNFTPFKLYPGYQTLLAKINVFYSRKLVLLIACDVSDKELPVGQSQSQAGSPPGQERTEQENVRALGGARTTSLSHGQSLSLSILVLNCNSLLSRTPAQWLGSTPSLPASSPAGSELG